MNPFIKFIYGPEEYIDSSGRITAISSFVLGTLLLVSYLILEANYLISIGILFVACCIFIHCIILIFLFGKIAFKLLDKRLVKSHLITLVIMLLNIPITLLYIRIVMDALNFSNWNFLWH